MKFAKPFGLTISVLAILLLAGVVVASQGSANSRKAKADKTEQKDKKTPISVPEPATLVLMGAAAAVAGVRKVWQDRRRSKSV